MLRGKHKSGNSARMFRLREPQQIPQFLDIIILRVICTSLESTHLDMAYLIVDGDVTMNGGVYYEGIIICQRNFQFHGWRWQ